jgi:hypothetical protein
LKQLIDSGPLHLRRNRGFGSLRKNGVADKIGVDA